MGEEKSEKRHKAREKDREIEGCGDVNKFLFN